MRAGRVVIGLGLNSRATQPDVLAAIDDALALIGLGLGRGQVETVATAEHRRGHPALTDLPLPVQYLGADLFATGEVAEPAARLAAPGGEMIVPKRCTDRVCVAVAELS